MTDQATSEVAAGADPVPERYKAAMALGHAGERAPARAQLAALWAEVANDGDALHRCAIAHALADLQDDPHDELAWDRRALAAADAVTDADAAAAGMAGPAAAMYPSLHLNLADVLHRLGDIDEARHHARLARGTLHALPDGGNYGQLVRDGIDRLDERLAGDR